MSLDVYLRCPYRLAAKSIAIATLRVEAAKLTGLAQEAYNVVIQEVDDIKDLIYRANITHNLNKMAMEAGIYEPLWRPDECGITKADQLIQPLTDGLARLRDTPAHFKKFNAANVWGVYENLISFVQEYLEACIQNPHALVSVWR